MDITLLIGRMILSAVFATAGIAKLYDRDGSQEAFERFGMPGFLLRPMSWLLPALELATAVALIPLSSAWLGGISALVLLSAFSIAIATQLARGETNDCHCFGKLESGPIGWKTLARNVILTGLAGFVVFAGPNGLRVSAVAWTSELRGPDVAILVATASVLAMLGVIYLNVRRINGELRTAVEQIAAIKKVVDEDYAEAPPVVREDFKAPKKGLPIGAPAPGFSLETVDGEVVTLDDLLAYGKQLVLLFVSSYCPVCKAVLDEVNGWQSEYGDAITFVVVSKGGRDQVRSKTADLGLTPVLLQGDPPISEKYRALWSPAAVAVSAKGRIASQVAHGDMAVREMVSNLGSSREGFSLASGEEPSPLAIGELLPEFWATDVSGNVVNSSELRGEDRVLIFWDPECRWCIKMLEDIRSWEEDPPKGTPSLTIIVSEHQKDVEHLLEGMKSKLLFNPGAGIAAFLGSVVAPAAIAIDGDGRITSSLVLGVKDVLALAGVERVRALIDSVV